MEERNVYRDMSQRTDGDIYIGVVGPVRTGKSTFIKRFMDALVLPNIHDESVYQRALDELPQSASGKTIMTTEPKFIPEESVTVDLGDNVSFKVRMIDCVGYVVDSALGHTEEDGPRMVKTPWAEEAIPFDEAAEIGTKKVITDHSSVGLVITTDGSFTDLPREEYEATERRVVEELQAIDKPFIVLLNSADPASEQAAAMAQELSARYQVPVLPVDCLDLSETEIKRVLAQLLFEFPIRAIQLDMPEWVVKLDREHPLKTAVLSAIRTAAEKTGKTREVQQAIEEMAECEHISSVELTGLDLGSGTAKVTLRMQPQLFYQVLSEQTGLEIADEYALLNRLTELSEKQREFDKIARAYEQVRDTGYGIVMPTIDELKLEEPKIIKQSGKYGVKLKASAPSIHMMRVQTQTEVTPIVGSEQQSEELVAYLLREFEESPEKIWESNIFGKSVHELVNEGLHNKLSRMPDDARRKIARTIERVINDGCNGLICIIV